MNTIFNTGTFFALSRHLIFSLMLMPVTLAAAGFSASFRNTDIGEFINTVSQNLGKTVIIDPAVKGQINVRSTASMTDEEYYHFFTSVLEVYGYAVIETENGLLKVLPAKNALNAAAPLSVPGQNSAPDEVITSLVRLRYSVAKEVATLLRPMTEGTGGAVIYPASSSILLITGRAGVVQRLTEVVSSIDVADNQSIERMKLGNAPATQVVETLNNLISSGKSVVADPNAAKLVADSRTNSVLIKGNENSRKKIRDLALSLDEEKEKRADARVIYLQHAKAENLLEVLSGVSNRQPAQGEVAAASVSVMKDVVIKADLHTNSLIISAPHEVMDELESIIAKLDISRPQVLVEAIIVEVQDADGLSLGVQWFNKHSGGTNFSDTGASATGVGKEDAFKKVTGLAAGFYRGNWAGLFTALQTNSENNILATPSIVTLDNMEAEFTVGQDVPILTGTQNSQSGDNIFNTVSRKSVGIKLKVKPQINKGDTVMMEIEQEVSSVVDKTTVENLGASFNTRSVKNAVLVDSGKTIVVGGLLDKSTNSVQSGVPVLSKIPLIGGLFRYTKDDHTKRNLMLFIRPTIIRTGETFDAITGKQTGRFEQQLQKSDAGMEALSDMYRELNTRSKKDPWLEGAAQEALRPEGRAQ